VFTGGVCEDASEGCLAGVGVRVEPERVACLGADFEVPGLALLPDPVHAVQVAVDPVDVCPIGGQPATAVDPGTPPARLGHFDRAAGQVGGEQA
jgi:hypothetical protein